MNSLKPVFAFLASQNGRIARIVLGALLILLGLFVLQTSTVVQVVLLLGGVVSVLAGAMDKNVLAPVIGLPMDGAKLREALK